MTLLRRWNLFCAVVDNYGDAGVAWRLARELATEHGLTVRLFCDRMSTLASLVPDVDAGRAVQSVSGVELRRWDGPSSHDAPAIDADVMVEMFGCGLPDSWLLEMSRKSAPPLWINVEYLSAEPWVDTTHGLASRHPRLPLLRYFFFPGFTVSTGGLLRERDLRSRREVFVASDAARASVWRGLGLAPPPAGALTLSLFCYPVRSLPALLDAWAAEEQPIFCAVPHGVASRELEAWSGTASMQPGTVFHRGRLALAAMPFVAQDEYDHLLWACDVNFVRGEDSLVRAQWAGRPLVWQAYRQAEDAHRLKLDAFIARYGAAMPVAAGVAYGAFSRAWNDVTPMHGDLWRAFLRYRPALDDHAHRWAQELERIGEFASSLVKFSSERV